MHWGAAFPCRGAPMPSSAAAAAADEGAVPPAPPSVDTLSKADVESMMEAGLTTAPIGTLLAALAKVARCSAAARRGTHVYCRACGRCTMHGWCQTACAHEACCFAACTQNACVAPPPPTHNHTHTTTERHQHPYCVPHPSLLLQAGCPAGRGYFEVLRCNAKVAGGFSPEQGVRGLRGGGQVRGWARACAEQGQPLHAFTGWLVDAACLLHTGS